MSNKPSFELSADSRFLLQELRKIRVGETVVYDALSTAIGRPVRGNFSSLQTAVRRLLRDDGIVFANVRGVGFKRLDDASIVRLGESETDATRRRARRTVRKLTSIRDYAALTPAMQLRHTALVSVNAMVADVTRDQSVKKVEHASGGRSGELPIAQTIKALGF
jgi:hypothetical protein